MMNRLQLILASAAAGLLAHQVGLAFDKQAGTPAPRALVADWEYATPRVLPQGLCFDQGRKCLYVALKNGGLAVLDVSRPQQPPRPLANVDIEQLGGLDVMHLTQKQDLLYLALGDFFNAKGSAAGLAVVSVAQPREPRVLSVWKSSEVMQGSATVLVEGRYAYLGAMSHGVLIFDVSDSKQITKAAAILPDVNYPRAKPNKVQHPNARGFAIRDGRLFVAFDAGGLRVIDIKLPLEPREIGRYLNAGMRAKQQAYNNLVVDGQWAYAAVDYAGLEILDLRNLRDIKQVAWWNPWNADAASNIWFNSPGHTNEIGFDAKRRLVYLSAGDSELLVVDVSDRTRPKPTARYGETKDKLGAWGLTMSPEHIYLTYINAFVPFHGTWSGIKAIRR